jgi:hypothetical protein
MQRTSVVLAIVFCAACGLAWGGAPAQQMQLKWDELDARIAKKKVAFVLPDGTLVEGKVIGVEPDGLRLKVTKSSNRKAQPKGKQLVARQAISVLRVTDYRKLGRLLGTTGAIAAAAGIVAAQQIDIYEGPAVIIVPAVVAGGTVGAGVGGYYLGKAFDKRVTEIRIVP